LKITSLILLIPFLSIYVNTAFSQTLDVNMLEIYPFEVSEVTPNVHVGALEVHPFVNIKQTYDTNIYLEPEGRENDDYITDVAAGIEIEMPLVPERDKDFLVKAAYKADMLIYYDQTRLNRVDHDMYGLVNFNFANGIGFYAKEQFILTQDPPNNERTSLDKRFRNIIDTSLSFMRENLKFQGGYSMIRDGYDDVTNLNKFDNRLTGLCFYQLFPKVSILGEYNLGLITYDSSTTNSDSTYNQARAGITGAILPKVTGTLKGGYRNVSYEQGEKDDYSGFTAFANVKYDVTERTVLNLYGERTTDESSYSDNSYYEINQCGLELQHQLLEHLWITGEEFLSYNRYPHETTDSGIVEKRRDTIWGSKLELKYQLTEWLYVFSGYEFKRRNSQFDRFDYDDHRVSIWISTRF